MYIHFCSPTLSAAAYVYDVHKVWGAWSEKLYMCNLNGEHNCELEKCCLESFFTLKMSQFIKFFLLRKFYVSLSGN